MDGSAIDRFPASSSASNHPAGRARARKVTLGHMNSDYAEVLGGLDEGNAVILGPAGRISDGSRVRLR